MGFLQPKKIKDEQKIRIHQVQMIWIHVSLQVKLQKLWSNRDSLAISCNATKSLCKFFSPFHVAIIGRTNLWGAKMQRCKHLRWGWFLGLDASGDIHLALLVFVLPTLWHWEDDTHWYLRLLTSVPLQNWSESTPTVMYLHVLHLRCRADVSPNDVAASEDTLVGRCILPASWDAHREVV